MAVTVTATPTSGTAATTAFRIDVDGLPSNDVATYSSGVANSMDEITYYFEMSEGGLPKGRSHVFSPNPDDGSHSWENIICPDAGTFTFTVKNATTDASVASVAVTIS